VRSPAVEIAGSCNAVRRDADGRLAGDLFDGEGFVRGLRRKGCTIDGASALVVGAGGVGSAIAASIAAAGAATIAVFDTARRGGRRARRPAALAPSGARGADRVGDPAASTSSSTRRRSA
jgi:shikimate dehydrogenase